MIAPSATQDAGARAAKAIASEPKKMPRATGCHFISLKVQALPLCYHLAQIWTTTPRRSANLGPTAPL